jgi:DNA-binding CsgD family transcriptional regulator
MVWYISLVSFGLATAVYKNLQSAAENTIVPEKKAILKSDKLSKREMDILMAFTNGFSYTEISDAMFISPHTVRTHLKNIYSKIGVNSKAEAVRWVLEETK